MERDLRELERSAASGDAEARRRLHGLWRRLGRGWNGERLPAGVRQGAQEPYYQLGEEVELPLHLVPPDRWAARLEPGPTGDGRGTYPRQVGQAVLAAGLRFALVDMSQAPAVSETSVAAMLQLWARLEERGGALVLYGVPPLLRDVLDLLGLSRLVGLEPDLERALAAVASAGAIRP